MKSVRSGLVCALVLLAAVPAAAFMATPYAEINKRIAEGGFQKVGAEGLAEALEDKTFIDGPHGEYYGRGGVHNAKSKGVENLRTGKWSVKGDQFCLSAPDLYGYCMYLYLSDEKFITVQPKDKNSAVMTEGTWMEGRPEWLRETPQDEKQLSAIYAFLIAATACGEQLRTFTTNQIDGFQKFAEQKTNDAGIGNDKLQELWGEQAEKFDNINSMGLSSDVTKLAIFCQRIALLQHTIIPEGVVGRQENPFVK